MNIFKVSAREDGLTKEQIEAARKETADLVIE